MPTLSGILEQFPCAPGQRPTHTAIGGDGVQGGSYHIPATSYDRFLSSYSDALTEGRALHLTEKPGIVFPVIADIDLEFKDDAETCERRHGLRFISDVAAAYANAAISMRQTHDHAGITVLVMHRRRPYVKSRGVVRDGLHIMLPDIKLPKAGQAILRGRAIPALTAALATIPGQTCDAEQAIDACYAENGANWQMYGSRKPGKEPYRVTHEFRFRIGETSDASTSASRGPRVGIVDAYVRAPLRDPEDLRFWSRFFSVRSCAPSHMTSLNDHAMAELDADEERAAARTFESVCNRELNRVDGWKGPDAQTGDVADTDEHKRNVERARAAAELLSSTRADDYKQWRDVGFALRNVSSTLIDTWHEFSKRSNKYDRHVCQMFWNKLQKRDADGLTLGSLIFWAQQDSPEHYQELQRRDTEGLLREAITHNTHTDWGLYIIEIYDGNLRSVPEGNNHAMYVFSPEKHRWILEEDATSVKCFIKKEVVDHVSQLMAQNENDADFAKLCDRAKSSLKMRYFRDNVIMDIRESVSDPDFRTKLDSNPNLIGWTNGVFDLEAQSFRRGRPDDHVSMTCGHAYKEPTDPAYAKHATEFEEFISKVHTNAALRKYCLDALATCLSGKTIFEIMHTWTGTGSNGKTRMLNLMDMALGDYICTAPPSLLTGTRPDSGKATPELCAAAGARLLIMSEVDGKATINVAVMKELSGGEKIATRELYKKSTVMVPQFTMLLTCNDLSKVDSNDDGTWRRLKVLPFRSKFVTGVPKDGEFRADTSLDAKMQEWAPYVLSMLQARYPQAVQDMRSEPQEVKEEVMNYRAASDLDHDFLEKNLIRRAGENGGDDDDTAEDADAWAVLNIYRREGRDSNITLAKLQDKLSRFGVPKAVDVEGGRRVFKGWRLASHGGRS